MMRWFLLRIFLLEFFLWRQVIRVYHDWGVVCLGWENQHCTPQREVSICKQVVRLWGQELWNPGTNLPGVPRHCMASPRLCTSRGQNVNLLLQEVEGEKWSTEQRNVGAHPRWHVLPTSNHRRLRRMTWVTVSESNSSSSLPVYSPWIPTSPSMGAWILPGSAHL